MTVRLLHGARALAPLAVILAACRAGGDVPAAALPPAPTPARALVERSVAYHGGAYAAGDTLRFRKTTELYTAADALERRGDQAHALAPATQAGHWRDRATGERVRYGANGARSTLPGADTARLRRAARAAVFTATLPQRLLDPGARLGAPRDTIVFGRAAVALPVDYPDGGPAAEPWVHFFDAATARHLGYFVDHGGEDALVRNVADTAVAGRILPTRRVTTRVAEGRERFVRGRFRYEYRGVPRGRRAAAY